ncbi:major facilitator superfamily domain-containing protein 8-like [Plakobranchus ocellatus]|uniref:Major facilitator superfamily domain-containing protein 8-like n=1 Tax=Plakobranchus ocellatus TaxID=259542 RepID=A0AAV4C4P8_9GAST|nr:major facilitator superfamily domain-containing protein 8-like [Plakobranchus ocellatus]
MSGPPVVILEPPDAYKSRWRSIRIMYMTMFLGCVTFTITISSLWPFLQVLDSDATPSFLGWVVAAYSLGQLVASPFFGAWANFRSSSREPLAVSLVLTVLFNVLYMYLQSIPNRPDIYMVVARGLVGFSAGNVAVVRSYLSAATTLKERTACMANVSIFQALGFILGPGQFTGGGDRTRTEKSVLISGRIRNPLCHQGPVGYSDVPGPSYTINLNAITVVHQLSRRAWSLLNLNAITVVHQLSRRAWSLLHNKPQCYRCCSPVIQTCLVPLDYPGPVELPGLHINMYTAPAVFASLLAATNLLLVLFVFREHKVDQLEEAHAANPIQSEDEEHSKDNSNGHVNSHVTNGHAVPLLESTTEESKPDLVAVLTTIFLFFIILFMFTVFETIGTPLTMHMYAWTKSEATLYQGIILGAAAATSIAVFVVVKVLAKRFNERYLLLAGFIFSFSAFIIYIPWGTKVPPLAFAPVKNATSAPNPNILELDQQILYYGHEAEDNFLDQRLSEKGREPLTFDISPKGRTEQDDRSPAFVVIEKPPRFKKSLQRIDSRDTVNFMVEQDRLSSVESRQVIFASGITKSQITEPPNSRKTEAINSRTSEATPSTTPEATTSTTGATNNTSEATTSTTLEANTTTTTEAKSTTSEAIPGTSEASTDMTPTQPEPNSTTSQSTIPTPAPPTNSTVSPEGCPWQYTWCRHVPMLPLLQYLAGTLVISIGYPMCQMLTYTIYSKILGPKPQGVWMGWITAAGSLARTVGPIYVSQVYDQSGPQITFASCAGLIFLTTVFYLLVFRRLVPFKEVTASQNRTAGTQHGA